MTLTYKRRLGIFKGHLHTKHEVSMSNLSKVRARTGQTHTQAQIDGTERITIATFVGENRTVLVVTDNYSLQTTRISYY